MPKGIFCRNFGWSRANFPKCRDLWCGKYYKVDPNFTFHVTSPLNNEGVKWKRKKKIAEFLDGFDGASLNAPFQCDNYWFINLRRRLPDMNSLGDEYTLAYTRRVSLDVLWSYSPGTANSSMAAFRKAVRIGENLGISPNYPHPGPWLVGGFVSFNTAIIMLGAS